MEEHYLLRCLREYPDVTAIKYGKRYELHRIEELVAHVRRTGRLTSEDVWKIRDNTFWIYERHWAIPDPQAVREGLDRVSERLDFWHHLRKRESLIQTLYEVFRNIEIVSIILRFVLPEYFGIYSPPMARILEVRRGHRDTETYLNYLENLDDIRRHYPGFRSIAEVNMAVWVLHERVYGVHSSEDIRKAFEEDRFLEGLRLRNMAHLLDLSDIRLARSLFPVNQRLSAQLAGFCFEQKVRSLYEKFCRESPQYIDLKELINRLHGAGAIDGFRAGMWHHARVIRNDALHSPEKLTEIGVRDLLAELEE